MSSHPPLVTVVIPTYNQADFLREALQSVVNQDFADWQAVVVNNHSSDHTKDVVAEIADPRIQIIDFNNEGVIAASRNLALLQATSLFVAFLDSDDWWHPTKLSRCVAALQTGSDLVCHSEEWRSSTSSRVVHYGPAYRTSYQELLLGGNCVSTSAVVGRTKLFQELGGFSTDPRFVTAEDYELWLRLAQSRAEFVFLNEVLGVFRIHSLSASASVDRNSRAEMAVVAHHLASAPFTSPAVQRRRLARSEYGAARAFHRSRDYNRALHWFWRSIRNAPFSARAYAGTGLAVLGALRALITRRTASHD
jgi:teichuronic acid biosynthesis glycosyltransferase TuaG